MSAERIIELTGPTDIKRFKTVGGLTIPVTCPHCGHTYDWIDHLYYPRFGYWEEHEPECPECNETFVVEICVTVQLHIRERE